MLKFLWITMLELWNRRWNETKAERAQDSLPLSTSRFREHNIAAQTDLTSAIPNAHLGILPKRKGHALKDFTLLPSGERRSLLRALGVECAGRFQARRRRAKTPVSRFHTLAVL